MLLGGLEWIVQQTVWRKVRPPQCALHDLIVIGYILYYILTDETISGFVWGIVNKCSLEGIDHVVVAALDQDAHALDL